MSIKGVKFGDGSVDWRDIHQQVESEWQKDPEALKQNIAQQLTESMEKEMRRRQMEQMNPLEAYKYRRIHPQLSWTYDQYNER